MPQINKDLEREWIDLSDRLDRVPTIGDFRTHIEKLRESRDDYKSFELGNKKNAAGKIIPNWVKAAAYEQATYDFLASLGHTVELEPVSNIDGVTSADCWVDGVLVEEKHPKEAVKILCTI